VGELSRRDEGTDRSMAPQTEGKKKEKKNEIK